MSKFRDFFNQTIEIGDYVAFYQSNNGVPEVHQVTGFNPKTLKFETAQHKKPADVIKIDPAQAHELYTRPIKDMLGNPLFVGDAVIASGGEYIDLNVYRITEIDGPKVETEIVYKGGRGWARDGDGRYGHDFIKVDERMVSWKVLTERKN